MKDTETPEQIARSVAAAGLVRATFSVPARHTGGGSPAEAEGGWDRVRVRPVALKDGLAYQAERFRGNQAFHLNVPQAGLEAFLARTITGFSQAEIDTKDGHIRARANRRGELSVVRSATAPGGAAGKTSGADGGTAQACAAQSHNREKNYLLREGEPVPFLVDLGVMTADGAVVKAKYDKFRQINRFLEFIEDVEPELRAAAKERGEITVVDFGCGKSYLTFAVYHYLNAIRGIPARIVGLDLKADVIAQCSALAGRYGYDRLSFACGNIEGYAGAERADMVITLHACDTATDFALAQAVRWHARVILSVPCCQHELNAQLAKPPRCAGEAPEDKNSGASFGSGRAVLEPALRYGIVRERMAALLTDSLRAELLENAGYGVQILEFIDMSHTPKNLLIRAVRCEPPVRHERAGEDTAGPSVDRTGRRSPSSAYAALRDFLGVEPTLEKEIF